MSIDFYQQFILPYAGIIIKICRAYTNSREDFEDYYQEVCLQIWQSRDNFKGQANWSTWIYRIALNVCLTLTRRAPKRTDRDLVDLAEQVEDQNHEQSNEFSVNQLYQAIKKLSEIDRGVILLYLEERSYQEIADIMGTNPNNIGVRIKRIKERLKKHLDEHIH